MNKPASFILVLLHVALFALIAWVLYGAQFETWGNQIPGTGEDGAKNYYTVAYHIEHDSSYTWFNGMNYPYGEHAVYTDNQPLVSNALKLLSGSADQLPWLVFISILIAGLCIQYVAIKAGAPWWVAVIGSLSVVFISPQLLRLGGHYSLAYVAVIPIVILFLWKSLTTNRARYSIALSVFLIAAGFIHPYFLIMLSMFWLFTLLVQQANDGRLGKSKHWMRTILLPVLPIVLFQLLVWLGDDVSDRPSSPYGFLFYRATWSSIFLPLDFDYFNSFRSTFKQSAEGGYFIGIFGLIGFVMAIVILGQKRLKGLSRAETLFVASIPLLLLSLAFPFTIWRLDQLLEYLGPLQQFRGVGRFSFVFFYAVNLLAIVNIGTWLKGRSKPYALIFSFALFAVLAMDVYSIREQVISKTISGTSVFHSEEIAAFTAKVNTDQYDAIIPLPYFHVGSEGFRTRAEAGIQEYSFALSLKTGLPLTGVQMSRTSLKQTLSQFNAITFPWNQIAPSNKNYLVLVKRNVQLRHGEDGINRASSFLDANSEYELRQISSAEIEILREQEIALLTQQMTNARSLSDSLENYQSFDAESSINAYRGAGMLHTNRTAWTNLIPATFHFEKDTLYELSFWFQTGTHEMANTQVWYKEFQDDVELDFHLSEVVDYTEQVDGNWILCVLPLRVQNSGNKIQIQLHRGGKKMDILLDEILLRSESQNYFRAGTINLNNRYAEPSLGSSVQ